MRSQLYLIATAMKISNDDQRAIGLIMFCVGFLCFLIGLAGHLKEDYHSRAESHPRLHRRSDSGRHRPHPVSVFVEKETGLNYLDINQVAAVDLNSLGDCGQSGLPIVHEKDPAASAFLIAAFSLSF